MQRTPIVLILGVGSYAGLQIAESFNQSSWPFLVETTDADPWALGFAAVHGNHLLPLATAPDYDERLVHLCRQLHVDAVFVTSRAELQHLSPRRTFFEAQTGARFFISPHDTMRTVNDRWQTHVWLTERGFPTVATLRVPTSHKRLRQFVASTHFPIIMRCRHQGDQVGAVVVDTRPDLRERMAELGKPVILQEYVEGPEVAIHVTCCRTGEVVTSAGYYQELRNGITWRAEVRELSRECELCERVAREMKIYGPCRIALRHSQGHPVILDIEATWNVGTGVLALAGVHEAVELAVTELGLGSRRGLKTTELQPIDVGRCWLARVLHPRADRPDP